MNEYETIINTLEQLYQKIADEHYGDIRYLEDEDDRYTIAINNAVKVLKEKGISIKPQEINEKQIKLNAIWDWTCGKCGRFHRNDYPLNYCSECGQRVDWSDWK